jgi:chromosome partitioning protein
VVDTDPQGSLADWCNQRAAETPLFAAVDVARLAEHMTALQRQGVQLVVIDTPPAFAEEIVDLWKYVETQLRHIRSR